MEEEDRIIQAGRETLVKWKGTLDTIGAHREFFSAVGRLAGVTAEGAERVAQRRGLYVKEGRALRTVRILTVNPDAWGPPPRKVWRDTLRDLFDTSRGHPDDAGSGWFFMVVAAVCISLFCMWWFDTSCTPCRVPRAPAAVKMPILAPCGRVA